MRLLLLALPALAALPPNPTRADYDREIAALNAQVADIASQLSTANATIAQRDVDLAASGAALAACDADVAIVVADHAQCIADLTAASVERDKHRAVTNGLGALVAAGQAAGIQFVVEAP